MLPIPDSVIVHLLKTPEEESEDQHLQICRYSHFSMKDKIDTVFCRGCSCVHMVLTKTLRRQEMDGNFLSSFSRSALLISVYERFST